MYHVGKILNLLEFDGFICKIGIIVRISIHCSRPSDVIIAKYLAQLQEEKKHSILDIISDEL